MQVLEGAANPCYKLGAEPCMWQKLANFPDIDMDMNADNVQQHKFVGAKESLAPNKWRYLFAAPINKIIREAIYFCYW